jgi:hypothetical protein
VVRTLAARRFSQGRSCAAAAGKSSESNVRGRFLKKAAQKLFRNWVRGVSASTAQFNKVFLLLFVHKK